MKYITLEMLKQADACDDQRLLFKDTFGSEAELTEANMAKAIEAGLDFVWLTLLLTKSMRKAYVVQHAPLWKAYEAQNAPLRKAYEAGRWSLLGTVRRTDMWKVYEAQNAPLLKAYVVQRNTLLLNALIAA